MSKGPILVLNAGSSSLKFSLFRLDAAGALQLTLRGQIDGIGTRPHLKASDEAGRNLVDRDMAPDEAREVKDAIAFAGAWLRGQLKGEPLLAVGHRVVHGGAEYSRPVLVDYAVFDALEKLIPLPPCTSRTTWRRFVRCVRRSRRSPRLPVSTRPFTAPTHRWLIFMRCPGNTMKPG
jgi:acetate kinase